MFRRCLWTYLKYLDSSPHLMPSFHKLSTWRFSKQPTSIRAYSWQPNDSKTPQFFLYGKILSDFGPKVLQNVEMRQDFKKSGVFVLLGMNNARRCLIFGQLGLPSILANSCAFFCCVNLHLCLSCFLKRSNFPFCYFHSRCLWLCP